MTPEEYREFWERIREAEFLLINPQPASRVTATSHSAEAWSAYDRGFLASINISSSYHQDPVTVKK